MATREVREKEISRIFNRDGSVRASIVVKESRPKKAALHDEFEWNNEIAAEQHRLATARRLIKTTPIRSKTGVMQQLVHVPSPIVEGPTAATNQREGAYKPISVVAKNPDERRRTLEELEKQVRAMQQTIRLLKKISGEQDSDLLPTLNNAMEVAKRTIGLMLHGAA